MIIHGLEQHLIDQFKGKTVLVKYGGNAMLNNELKRSVVSDICYLHDLGIHPVVVHGGGPFINDMLEKMNIKSEFIDGQRKTTPEALMYIEMVLKGKVNSDLVAIINSFGKRAVGLSGKDGKMATAVKRNHIRKINGTTENIDLERVGDITSVTTGLINLLTQEGYIPVIASIASGDDHLDYNINADMFAGHLAGTLQAEAYIAITDVDGLMQNPKDSSTLIREINSTEAEQLQKTIASGGMIPKMDSCIIALNGGVKNIRIINGTIKHSILLELFTTQRIGTLIRPV